jgi:hypothetical protein
MAKVTSIGNIYWHRAARQRRYPGHIARKRKSRSTLKSACILQLPSEARAMVRTRARARRGARELMYTEAWFKSCCSTWRQARFK